MRLLLVEDEKRLSDAIAYILKKNKYTVDIAFDGRNGLEMAETDIYDIIILDIMLPVKDGISVLKELREKKIVTPVLMLTARDTLEDKIKGLDAGADDYLVKPFATEELLARLRALGRRKRDSLQMDKLTAGLLSLDILRGEALCHEKIIRLTIKESQLLELFMRNKGQVLTKEQIIDRVWGYGVGVEPNNVEIYIHYLRKKIEPENCKLKLETVRGIGYCLREDSNV